MVFGFGFNVSTGAENNDLWGYGWEAFEGRGISDTERRNYVLRPLPAVIWHWWLRSKTNSNEIYKICNSRNFNTLREI
jgi:hypothetical protein